MVVIWHERGQGGRISADTYGYYEIAQNLAGGHGFRLEGKPTSRRGPVYPSFLALFEKLHSFPLGVQLVQAVLGAISCVLLFWLGSQVFGKEVGLVAAGIYAVDYLAIRQVVSLMPEVLFVFLLLASVGFIIQGEKRNQFFSLALGGILGGLAVLTKEVMAFYFIFLAFWLGAGPGSKGSRVLRAGIFLLGFVIIAAPWIVRNQRTFGEWGFVTSNVGHMFYLGNNSLISGRIVGEEWEYSDDSGFPQNDPAMPLAFTPEADKYLMRRGLQYVRSHPGRFLQLTGGKILRLWYPYYLGSPPAAKWLTILTYLPILVLGGWGIVRSSKRGREVIPFLAPIVYLTGVYAVTISGIRYRFPAMPFLTLFAAFALCQLFKDRTSSGYAQIGEPLQEKR